MSALDIYVENPGPMQVIIELRTPAARRWTLRHGHTEPWQWRGGKLVTGPRFALPFLRGAHDAGLAVG